MQTMSKFLVTLVVVGSAFALTGCPKRPDLDSAGAGAPGSSAVGPTAAVSARTDGASAGTAHASGSMTETRVLPQPALSVSSMAAASGSQGLTAGQKSSPLNDVFFQYDDSQISPEQAKLLEKDAAWLKDNAKSRVTVEGNCDERGTDEYNLALGERRAQAARDFLVAAGIAPGRIDIVSYGKERPFIMGHDESAWKWNRRDHLVVK